MGFEVAIGSITEIQRVARADDADQTVILIPTKELVFSSRVPDPAAHVGLTELVAAETAARRLVMERLEKAGIPVIDLLGPLRDSPESPYFEDADGHPNPGGHARIAREVQAGLESRGTTSPGR